MSQMRVAYGMTLGVEALQVWRYLEDGGFDGLYRVRSGKISGPGIFHLRGEGSFQEVAVTMAPERALRWVQQRE